jgi:ankyrin repeat protein
MEEQDGYYIFKKKISSKVFLKKYFYENGLSRKMRFFSDFSKNSTFRTNMSAIAKNEQCPAECGNLDTAVMCDCLEHFDRFFREDRNILDQHNATLLHRAAELKSPKILEYLLKTGTFDVNTRDGYGYTPLHLAVEEGIDEYGYRIRASEEDIRRCTQLLLSYGADPTAEIFYGKKSTPIDFAAGANNEELVEMLQNATLDIKDPGFD